MSYFLLLLLFAFFSVPSWSYRCASMVISITFMAHLLMSGFSFLFCFSPSVLPRRPSSTTKPLLWVASPPIPLAPIITTRAMLRPPVPEHPRRALPRRRPRPAWRLLRLRCRARRACRRSPATMPLREVTTLGMMTRSLMISSETTEKGVSYL